MKEQKKIKVVPSLDLLSIAYICFGEFTSREQSKIIASIQTIQSCGNDSAEGIFKEMVDKNILTLLNGTANYYEINVNSLIIE